MSSFLCSLKQRQWKKIAKEGDKASPPLKTNQAEALLLDVEKRIEELKSQVDDLANMLQRFIKIHEDTQQLMNQAIAMADHWSNHQASTARS